MRYRIIIIHCIMVRIWSAWYIFLLWLRYIGSTYSFENRFQNGKFIAVWAVFGSSGPEPKGFVISRQWPEPCFPLVLKNRDRLVICYWEVSNDSQMIFEEKRSIDTWSDIMYRTNLGRFADISRGSDSHGDTITDVLLNKNSYICYGYFS